MVKDDFGHIANRYDEIFTHSIIGKFQRQVVYQTLNEEKVFGRIQSVFELNCGTGYDAQLMSDMGLKVTATDASHGMIEFAKRDRSSAIQFKEMTFSQLDQAYVKSDLIFSNFGGLNCIDKKELQELVDTMAKVQSQGQMLALVIMPSFCLMESIYYLFKFRVKEILRRLKRKGVFANVDHKKVMTFYHSPHQVSQLLKQNYRVKRIRPVGLFVPPSYLEPLMQRSGYLSNALIFLDNLFNRISKLAMMADHYIIIAERK